jgi:hypothetical protein
VRRLRACVASGLGAVVACIVVGLPVDAKLFHSQKEAVALAFPNGERVESHTFILTAEQVERIESQARSKLESKLVKIYTGFAGDVVTGYAHIDVHNVRTKAEGLMVVLTPAGRVRSVRMLAFHEPLDYLPAGRWYAQFEDKARGDALRVGRDIHGIVGSTLSARAATKSVRRALAYYDVLLEPKS